MKTLISSLIISTYNWPEALELVLKSIIKQKVLPDEVIIADDGSTEGTKKMIENFQLNFPVPLIHVWQEDDGFKKSSILNKAIAKAKGNYIIQVDGDCILHSGFVKDHLAFAKKGQYLFGSRVNIQEPFLNELFEKQYINFHMFSAGIKKRTRALRVPLFSSFYKESEKFSKKYRGCNTSYFKEDAIEINGYNEDIQGWGREDSEFALRLHNLGIKGRRLRYRGIVFHIYHIEKSKERLDVNDKIERDAIKNKIIKCTNGIKKYLTNK